MNNFKSSKYILVLLILITVLSILIFIIKFYKFSFINSTPEDWNFFISYLSGIINPILTIVNILIFIKLTQTIQRASENKSWVERTEKLTFDLINSISNEAAYFSLTIPKISKIAIENQLQFVEEQKVYQIIGELNTTVTICEYNLRLFIDNNVFSNCKSQKDFIKKLNKVVPILNAFIGVLALDEEDKSEKLQLAYNDIEKLIKELIISGKTFCDEVYYL